MYKLLVVDDFEIDRENLKECIDWESIGITTIMEAGNGVEAMKLIEESRSKPDFILTDVQMPFMDGIELARKVHEQYPGIKVIFTSYYQDFEYVKSAVDLNAHGYILKPVIPDEMLNCFQKVIDRLQEEKNKNMEVQKAKKLLQETKPLLIERFYKNLLTGNVKDEESIWMRAEYLGIHMQKGYFRLLVIELEQKEAYRNTVSIEDMDLFGMSFLDTLQECCRACEIYMVTHIDDNHYAIIINQPYISGIHQYSALLFRKVAPILTKYEKYRIYAGVSNISSEVEKLDELYRQCLYALKFKFCFPNGEIIKYSDIQETKDVPHIKLSTLQEDINFLINTGNEEEIGELVRRLFQDIVIRPDNNYIKSICFTVIMCIQLTLHEMNGSFEDAFDDEENVVWNKLMRFESIIDLKQWLKNILMMASDYVQSLKQNKNSKLVDEIIEYLKSELRNNVTVKDVSEKFYFSPNYLNHIFKEKTGKTIPDYLTMLRMEKARELLKERDMKVYQVVEAVGYTRTSYFANLFRKYTGLSPKEYREMICE